MKRGKSFIALTVVLGLILLALFFHGRTAQLSDKDAFLPARQALVSRLGLTDPSLWTEARYTRHPSQTDFFSAFQDFPGAPDHFPSGSIIAPSHAAPGERE